MRSYETKKVEVDSEFEISRTCNRCSSEIKEDGYEDRKNGVRAYTATCYPGDEPYNEGWLVTDLCDPCSGWLKQILIEGGVKIEDASDREYW